MIEKLYESQTFTKFKPFPMVSFLEMTNQAEFHHVFGLRQWVLFFKAWHSLVEKLVVIF